MILKSEERIKPTSIWQGGACVTVLTCLLSAVLLLGPRARAGLSVLAVPQSKGEPMKRPMISSSLMALLFLTGTAGSDADSVEGAEEPAPVNSPAAAAKKTVDRTKVPEALVGFSGRLIGRLVTKDVEKGELVLDILVVDRVWKQNRAKEPKSAEGRRLTIDGVFGRFLDNLLTMQPGDGVQIETKHVRGDKLSFLGEYLSKVSLDGIKPSQPDTKPAANDSNKSNAFALNGFKGILIGTLLTKDPEKGSLTFKIEKVKQVWKQNKAEHPERSAGTTIRVNDIAGKWLDVLLGLRPGDRIEVEAFHTSGDALHFVGEWLKKAE
jgi:hypothetical protein